MRQQHEEVFKDLYRRYYKRILLLFIRLHFSEEDARDLTQETFLRVYEALDDYRGDAKWAFLDAIAQNLAKNRYRSQSTKKRGAQTVAIEDVSMAEPRELSNEPDYVDQITQSRQRELLYDEIAKLPPRQKRCLLRRLRGESYEHIAKIENTTVDAVKAAIRDAKKRLVAKLGAHVLPEEDQ